MGTVGYMVIENWSIFDSLWMTIITMSTVGYGEVRPLTQDGRSLSIVLILATLIVGGYAFGNIGAFLIGGEVGNIIKGRKMERELARINNHVLLIGYGAVGREASRAWGKSELLVIEQNCERYEKALTHGRIALLGDAADEDVLEKAGITRAKGIMIAIGDVANTVLIALTAKELNPKVRISARIDDPNGISKLKRVGVDNIVAPSQIGGRRLAEFLKHPALVDFLDLVMRRDDIEFKLKQVEVHEGSELAGKTLKEIHLRRVTGGASVLSIRPRDKQCNINAPDPDYRMKAGDSLISLGTDDSFAKLSKLAGGEEGEF